MIKIQEKDYVKIVTENDNFVYKVLKFIPHINHTQALLQRCGDGYNRKVKIKKLYKVNKKGEIYELPKVKKGEVKMSSKRNRNPNNIQKDDLVTFLSAINNKQYKVIEANSSTCWVQDPKNPSEILKGVHYYKLQLVKKKPNNIVNLGIINPKDLYIKNEQLNSFSFNTVNSSNKTGELVIHLSNGDKQTIALMDNIEVLSVDYSRTVKSTIKL